MPGHEPTEPSALHNQGSEAPKPQLHTGTDPVPVDQASRLTKDPTEEVAGQVAANAVLAGVNPELLSEEEKSVFLSVAARHRAKAEQEARETHETAPDKLLIDKLTSIHDQLSAAGLDADAVAIAEECTRLTNMLGDITDYVRSGASANDLNWFRSPAGSKDVGRLIHFAHESGVMSANLARGLMLSNNPGGGAREDRTATWYKPETLATGEHDEMIERSGGLTPILSDQALEIILRELGILQPGAPLSSLDTEQPRPDLHSARYSRYGKLQYTLTSEQQPGVQYDYAVYPQGPTGHEQRQLRLRLADDFVIKAALQHAGEAENKLA